MQHEPHASGPWTGTALLTAVMLPSRDLAGEFCSLTPPSATYIHRLDLFEPGFGKEKIRVLPLKSFLGGNPEVRGCTGLVK